jgi:hypothetical protein
MPYWSTCIHVIDIPYEDAEEVIRLSGARWCPTWGEVIWSCWREVGWADPRDNIPPPGIEVYQLSASSIQSLGLDVGGGGLYVLFLCPALQWAVLARPSGDIGNIA